MIDFRSDTVTRPTQQMRQTMAEAPVGDDVYGDDPTVNQLQAFAADTLGFEAALFTSSGTQANLLAILSHCERGDEYICGQQAHNYKYEAGGAAVLGSVQPQPLTNQADGTIALADINAAIKQDDFHFAKTRLISLENTIGGKVLPLSYQAEVRKLANERQLALHLDGARVFHAATKQAVPVQEITQHYDSVSICLSKGLGAPVGSLLLGSKELIKKATRLRKMLGGGMRQAGILAAAGKIAFEQMPLRLEEDHQNAALLAQALKALPQLDVTEPQTNIVYAKCLLNKQNDLRDYLLEQGILISAGDPIRFVTHLDIKQEDIITLTNHIKSFYQKYE
ncbi:low-specificity L-threonine aldolase [Marinomonas agarivorans]|nr:low-specificity L-threonine aldolase [Marinomonas agarivorans]